MKGCGLMAELIDILTNNGVAVAMLAYFAYRDYKFNTLLVTTLNDLKNNLNSGINKITLSLKERGEKK